jgi:hypothetical protein
MVNRTKCVSDSGDNDLHAPIVPYLAASCHRNYRTLPSELQNGCRLRLKGTAP